MWREVNPEELPVCWPLVAPLVRQALAAGEGSYNEKDVLHALLGGLWQLWSYGDEPTSICITEIIQFPRKRKCLIRYVAGVLAEFDMGLIEGYARGRDCTTLEVYGRKGWLRRLPDWTERYSIIQKDL